MNIYLIVCVCVCYWCVHLIVAAGQWVVRNHAGITLHRGTCENVVWRIVAAQNRNGWHSVVKSRIEDCNRLDEEEKKCSKDEQKRRCEDRQMTSNTALSCDHSGCDFMALSEAGMANHKRQNIPNPDWDNAPIATRLITTRACTTTQSSAA